MVFESCLREFDDGVYDSLNGNIKRSVTAVSVQFFIKCHQLECKQCCENCH